MALSAALITGRSRVPLVALLAANAISLVGSALTAVALPWFVLQTTGSAARTGLVAAAAVLPAAAGGLLGGALVDRLGFKRVGVVSDVVGGVGIALIPLLDGTVGLAFWQLLLLVFVGALLDIPGLTARRSLLPDLAAAAGWRLERANAAFESSQHLALLLGPPVAGILVAALGAADVLWLDAATFAASAALVAGLVPAARAVRQSAAAGRGGYLGEIAAGLRFLRADRLLFALALTLTAANFLSGPLVAVLLPVFVAETYGRATALGLAIAALGVGWLVGGLLYGSVGHRVPRRPLLLLAFLVGPIEIWILAASPTLPVLVATFGLAAVLGGPINPLLVTVRHERIPAELRGRVFATFSALAMLAQPAGLLLGGVLIDAVGFRPTVLLLAAGAQLVGVALLFVPALREMDASPAAHGPTSAGSA